MKLKRKEGMSRILCVVARAQSRILTLRITQRLGIQHRCTLKTFHGSPFPWLKMRQNSESASVSWWCRTPSQTQTAPNPTKSSATRTSGVSGSSIGLNYFWTWSECRNNWGSMWEIREDRWSRVSCYTHRTGWTTLLHSIPPGCSSGSKISPPRIQSSSI